jgi:hypothetical protein
MLAPPTSRSGRGGLLHCRVWARAVPVCPATSAGRSQAEAPSSGTPRRSVDGLRSAVLGERAFARQWLWPSNGAARREISSCGSSPATAFIPKVPALRTGPDQFTRRTNPRCGQRPAGLLSMQAAWRSTALSRGRHAIPAPECGWGAARHGGPPSVPSRELTLAMPWSHTTHRPALPTSVVFL